MPERYEREIDDILWTREGTRPKPSSASDFAWGVDKPCGRNGCDTGCREPVASSTRLGVVFARQYRVQAQWPLESPISAGVGMPSPERWPSWRYLLC